MSLQFHVFKFTFSYDLAGYIHDLVYENPEELCITCHNAESPTYVDFDFAESWEKIKHNVPE